MNRVNVIAVAMTGILAGSAFAATSTAPVVKKSNIIVTKKKVAPVKKVISKNTPAVSAASLSKPTSVAMSTAPAADTLTVSSSSATSSASAVMPGSSAGTTTKSLGEVAKKPSIADKLSFAISLEYYGSALSDPLSGYQPNVDEEASQSDGTNKLDTHLILGYKLTPNLKLSLNPYFTSQAGSQYQKEAGTGGGQLFMKPTASYIKLGVGKFYSQKSFTWNGDFRYYPGVTDDLEAGGIEHYLRTGQNFSWGLSPKFTFSAYNTIRYYVVGQDTLATKRAKGAGMPKEFRVTMSPTLEYQASDSIQLSFSYNADVNKPYDNDMGHWANAGGADAEYWEAGMTWGISKTFEFNPYLDMYRKHMDPNAMQLGANLSINIL